MRRIALMIALCAAVTTVLAVAATGGQGPQEPPKPDWVDATGRVDPSKLPEYIFVAGPNGEPVTCKNGQQLRIRGRSLIAPPPPIQLTDSPRQTGESVVYRCGKGANPHLNPLLVPESADPLAGAVTAP